MKEEELSQAVHRWYCKRLRDQVFTKTSMPFLLGVLVGGRVIRIRNPGTLPIR